MPVVARSLPRLRAHVALPALLLALGACGDDGGPRFADDLPVSASVMYDKAAEIYEVGRQPAINAILGPIVSGGMGELATRTVGARITPGAPGAPGATAGDTPLARRLGALRGLRDLPPSPLGQVGGGFFPASILGRTYIQDGAGNWVVDTLANGTPRPGAPATGVRFVLVEVNMFGEPAGGPVGTLDVTPRFSGMTPIGYRGVIRAIGGAVVMQYDSEQSSSMTGYGSDASGYITDGTRRIELSSKFTETGLASTVAAAFAGVTRTTKGSAEFESDDEFSSTTTTTVRIDDGTIRHEDVSTDFGLREKLFSNGGLFAQRTWEYEDPEPELGWMRGDGRTELDAEDLESINAFYSLMIALPELLYVDLSVQLMLFEVAYGDSGPFF